MTEPRYIDTRTFQERMARRGHTVSLQTLWRWCRGGFLKARKLPRDWLILETEVDRVLGEES